MFFCNPPICISLEFYDISLEKVRILRIFLARNRLIVIIIFSAKVYTGQPIDRTALQQDPQVQAILTRFKNAERAEDKDKVLNDLKKMPHLFAAFIKMTNNERSGGDVSLKISK